MCHQNPHVGIEASKSVFKGGGGVQGVQTPPPQKKNKKLSDFFLKSEGKEVEKKIKINEKGWKEGGLIVNIFLGSQIYYLLLLCGIGYNVVKWSHCEFNRDLFCLSKI